MLNAGVNAAVLSNNGAADDVWCCDAFATSGAWRAVKRLSRLRLVPLLAIDIDWTQNRLNFSCNIDMWIFLS